MTKLTPLNPPSGSSIGPPRFSGLGHLLRQAAPKGLPLLVILLLLLVAFLYATCKQYIHPDQFAVKEVYVPMSLVTGAAVIHTNSYDTGVHWRTPGCEKFLVFPKSVRAVTLHAKSRGPEGEEKFVRYEDAAHIQTS